MLKQDIINLFGMVVEARANTDELKANTVEAEGEYHRSLSRADIKSEMKEVIEEFFQTKQTQLMRPMEEQAFYLVGELKNEVKHLQAEKEILRQELDKYKALPGPVAQVIEKLQEQEKQLQKIQEKRKELEAQQKESLKEQEAKLRAEAEAQMKEVVEAWKKELEQAKKPWWKFW